MGFWGVTGRERRGGSWFPVFGWKTAGIGEKVVSSTEVKSGWTRMVWQIVGCHRGGGVCGPVGVLQVPFVGLVPWEDAADIKSYYSSAHSSSLPS